MTALIVGGDYVESIRKAIAERGMERIEHWNGRKPGDLRKTLPKGTKLIVVLYDYLSHSMLRKVNGDAAGSGIPIIHCRRGLGQVCSKLDEMDFCRKDCTSCTAGPAAGLKS
ncbi:MAG TPA: DUF2325 domain-containing protein [Geobacteraceae bacterium]|nr:DUF2325 domain-containing protein [Geobacteraceae bacterium]